MTDNADVLTNLCLAIYSKFTAETTEDEISNLMVIGDHAIGGVGPVFSTVESFRNDFYLSVNGQFFKDEAQDYAVYPYAVYSIPDINNDYTFSEDFTNTHIRLIIYSDNMSTPEIKLIYRYATDLFDECEFAITGSGLVWMIEENATFGIEQHITLAGTKKVLSYTIDFEVKTCLN